MLIRKCLTLNQIQYFKKRQQSAKREGSKVSMATQAQPTCRYLSTALRNYCVEDKDWQTSEWGRGRRTKTSTSSKPSIKIQNSPTVHNTGQVLHTREFKMLLRRQQRELQKRNRLNKVKARASRFFVHFFAVTAQLRREWPNLTFYRQLEHTTTNFFLPLNLNFFLKNSAPGKFAYIGQSKRVGIIAPKFQRTRSLFLSDVSPSSPTWYLYNLRMAHQYNFVNCVQEVVLPEVSLCAALVLHCT